MANVAKRFTFRVFRPLRAVHLLKTLILEKTLFTGSGLAQRQWFSKKSQGMSCLAKHLYYGVRDPPRHRPAGAGVGRWETFPHIAPMPFGGMTGGAPKQALFT